MLLFLFYRSTFFEWTCTFLITCKPMCTIMVQFMREWDVLMNKWLERPWEAGCLGSHPIIPKPCLAGDHIGERLFGHCTALARQHSQQRKSRYFTTSTRNKIIKYMFCPSGDSGIKTNIKGNWMPAWVPSEVLCHDKPHLDLPTQLFRRNLPAQTKFIYDDL